ncbi:MAG: hypothetical protein ACOWW1_10300 [archaeon]
MTKSGWKTVVMKEETIKKVQRCIDEINFKQGKRQFRSVSQFVEEAVNNHLSSLENSASEPEGKQKN